MLDRAIEHANEQAREHAAAHYQARDQLMERRRLQDAPRRRADRSTLLLRMASLRKSQARLDDNSVLQLFPNWIEGGEWRHEAVLKDLVRAVADLAAAIEAAPEQKTEF